MQRHQERAEHERYLHELTAAIVAHTVATFAGKELKEHVRLAYGDFMPSQTEKLRAARSQAFVAGLRDYLQGLARDKGLLTK